MTSPVVGLIILSSGKFVRKWGLVEIVREVNLFMGLATTSSGGSRLDLGDGSCVIFITDHLLINMTPERTSKHITMMNKEVRERTATIVTTSPSVKLFQIDSILLTRLM